MRHGSCNWRKPNLTENSMGMNYSAPLRRSTASAFRSTAGCGGVGAANCVNYHLWNTKNAPAEMHPKPAR